SCATPWRLTSRRWGHDDLSSAGRTAHRLCFRRAAAGTLRTHPAAPEALSAVPGLPGNLPGDHPPEPPAAAGAAAARTRPAAAGSAGRHLREQEKVRAGRVTTADHTSPTRQRVRGLALPGGAW